MVILWESSKPSFCDGTKNRLWAKDLGIFGAKKWAITPKELESTLRHFYKYFGTNKSCFYEVLQYDIPCRVYVDVDLKCDDVWNLYGACLEPAFTLFRETLQDALCEMFGYRGDLTYSRFTSSNETCISEHWIFNVCASDIRVLKVFIIDFLLPAFTSRCLATNIHVDVAKSIDIAVYNNRPFRIPYSSKKGQLRFLHPCDETSTKVSFDMYMQHIGNALIHVNPSDTCPMVILPQTHHELRSQRYSPQISEVPESVETKLRHLFATHFGSDQIVAMRHSFGTFIQIRFQKGVVSCPNIGMPHRNNNIYAQFCTASKQITFKCMDPECGGLSFPFLTCNRKKYMQYGYNRPRICFYEIE